MNFVDILHTSCDRYDVSRMGPSIMSSYNWTLGASEYLLKVGDLEVWTSAGPRAANIVDYFEMDADISSF